MLFVVDGFFLATYYYYCCYYYYILYTYLLKWDIVVSNFRVINRLEMKIANILCRDGKLK